LGLRKGHISAFSNGPYGQKFRHGDSTNVLFITMEIHGQILKNIDYFSSNMVVAGR
jgi:hypothetical protein